MSPHIPPPSRRGLSGWRLVPWVVAPSGTPPEGGASYGDSDASLSIPRQFHSLRSTHERGECCHCARSLVFRALGLHRSTYIITTYELLYTVLVYTCPYMYICRCMLQLSRSTESLSPVPVIFEFLFVFNGCIDSRRRRTPPGQSLALVCLTRLALLVLPLSSPSSSSRSPFLSQAQSRSLPLLASILPLLLSLLPRPFLLLLLRPRLLPSSSSCGRDFVVFS